MLAEKECLCTYLVFVNRMREKKLNDLRIVVATERFKRATKSLKTCI